MVSIEDIRAFCQGRIEISEPLARMTSFRIGGPADISVEPESTTELIALLGYFRENDLPYIVLGNGSNVLIHDDGFRGAAINLEHGFSYTRFDGEHIDAGAGIRLASFVDDCIGHGLAGMEMLAGIPGTLGGAIIMNAGAYGGEISDFIVDVGLIRNGVPMMVPKDQCGFAYRNSGLKSDIVHSARFRFPTGDIPQLKARRKELLLKRNAAQPTNVPNAGSIFKNPPGDHAARLIELCGLKGFRIGGAEVSERHANFIVNSGNATSRDVLDVMNHVRTSVFQQTGIALEPEILLIGFGDKALDPLPATRDNDSIDHSAGATRQAGGSGS